MKMTITAKLQLQTTPEQFAALRATQLAYRDSLNLVSRYAFAHGKMSNKVKLQEGTYDEIRARFHLPSQMACSVPRQVGATYKGLWTKVKKNAEQMENLRKTFDTNFFGAFAVTKAFLPLIQKAEAGRIVNVSSGLGSLTSLSDPNFEYDALARISLS